MSSKKKEKEPWTKCENCEAYFPRAKFSLHNQDVCRSDFSHCTDGKNEGLSNSGGSDQLPRVGSIKDARFFAVCSMYSLEGKLELLNL